MANRVNQCVDPADRPDPTQGRRRECARRVRQMERQRQRAVVAALFQVPEPLLAQLSDMDDAQNGFAEQTAEQALLDGGDASPERYARAVLAAACALVDDST